MDKTEHWDNVYATKGEDNVSWFKNKPTTSLELINNSGIKSGIIDIGGGASRLIDNLIEAGFADLSVLDISSQGLKIAQERLNGQNVSWIVADITQWQPPRKYNLWHDWAVFHFLNQEEERAAYVKALKSALNPKGQVVIAAFALDGPTQCSNLPITRHSLETITQALGPDFHIQETISEKHPTPGGKIQSFNYYRLLFLPQ